MTLHTNLKPPVNARRIWRVADLSHERGPAQYEIANEGQPARIATDSKRQRQILELLLQGPVYCASPMRIGDTVHILKREIDLVVDTTMYPGDPATGSDAFGVYTLISRVRRIFSQQVAA